MFTHLFIIGKSTDLCLTTASAALLNGIPISKIDEKYVAFYARHQTLMFFSVKREAIAILAILQALPRPYDWAVKITLVRFIDA